MQIRIITGTAKNKKLTAPNIEGFRAVQDIAKGSIFSMIGDKVEGAVVLDIFAGSGNLGIEALSRGAVWCDFVDSHWESVSTIKENLAKCGFSDKGAVFLKEASKYVVSSENTYDIIFLDPFYKDLSHTFILNNLNNLLNEDGVAIFFHSADLKLDKIAENSNLEMIDERKFGSSYFTVLKSKVIK